MREEGKGTEEEVASRITATDYIKQRTKGVHDYADSYRHSGRTTNVILTAIAQLLRGNSVSIICYNSATARLNARRAWEILQAAIGDTLQLNFVTHDRIEVTIDGTIYFLYFVAFARRETELRARDCYVWYDNNHTSGSMEWYIREHNIG